jgi:hypothetical protein
MHKLILYIVDKNCNWKRVTLNDGVLKLRPKIEILTVLSDQLSVVVFQRINYKTSSLECTVIIDLNINSSVQLTQFVKYGYHLKH